MERSRAAGAAGTTPIAGRRLVARMLLTVAVLVLCGLLIGLVVGTALATVIQTGLSSLRLTR
ncbi:hypothetical protein GCM10009788_51260 [Nocardioides humi]|uniref:Uncharacterized protein n=2 Tax=Nocardioides humi TaxID=449461 RepID=A0ABN2BLG9_9ACTN